MNADAVYLHQIMASSVQLIRLFPISVDLKMVLMISIFQSGFGKVLGENKVILRARGRS